MKQRGYLLIEMLIVMTIVAVMACMALPQIVRMEQIAAEHRAIGRAQQLWQIIGSDETCHVLTPSQCGPLDGMIPAANQPARIGPYTWTFSGIAQDGSWAYTGTPSLPMLRTVSVSSTGPLLCNGVPCQ